MTDIKVALESYVAVIDEMRPILAEHWEELATYSDIPLDPDYAAYEDIDKKGLLAVYTVRVKGELVGYSVYFVRRHLHYQGHVFATNDIILVRKPYRNYGVGTALFDFIEDDLRAKGVNVIFTSAKSTHPELATLLETRGHQEVSRGFSVRL